ncbi:MAG: M28 family peptidase [Gemmatimonadetes bacterium]|nr:M28 family peptidase [Gemmatimonadota bacterium]MDA1102573.1 M28 family peptidase [Gemmatimonadota bacterium]
MRRHFCTLLTAVLVVPVLAVAPSVADAQQLATADPVLSRIWEEGMNNSHFESLAQALLDSIGPRLTASPGMERAQDWAAKTLRGWGIEARLEQYGTWEGWNRGVSHVDLVSPRVRSLEGRILAWSPGTAGRPVEGAVTYLPEINTPADWTAFLGTVRGKWVMISFPEPTCRADEQWIEFGMEGSPERMAVARAMAEQRWERSLAMVSRDNRRRDVHSQLEAAGAAGVITSDWPGSYGTTRVFNAYNRETPTFELGCEDYSLVHRLAANGQNPIVRLTAEAENRGEVPVFNVIGEIPGTTWPDQYVMLSAHFDSWESGSGATDNGSGSVLMLETMRIIKEVYPNPKRTILIGLWSGEEQGLNGSRAYTEDHPEVVRGLQALWNQDNGTGRVERISAQGLTGAGGSLAKWLSLVPTEVSRHVDLELPGNPGGGGSDYASFVCHGAPGFSLSALSWDYSSHTWHTHRDTFDKLVFDDLKNNAVLTASLVYLASEDPDFVDRTRRTIVTGQGGGPAQWPTCTPAQRASRGSERM